MRNNGSKFLLMKTLDRVKFDEVGEAGNIGI